MANKNYNMKFKMTDGSTKSVPFSMPGGADIDVTAEVGQTIVVEEVDADGKPTKWKAVDYQPRTHWTDVVEIVPETTVELSDGSWEGEVPFSMEIGQTYKVIWNGTEYTCMAHDAASLGYAGGAAIGNLDLALGTGNTGEPFVIGTIDGYGRIAAVNGATASVTFSIVQKYVKPIPGEYLGNAFPYYIEVTGSGTDDDPYVCNDTVANVKAVVMSGRTIVLREGLSENGLFSINYYNMILATNAATGEENNKVLWLWFSKSLSSKSIQNLYLKEQADGTFAVSDTFD